MSGHWLVIAEKPAVARDIAEALSHGKPHRAPEGHYVCEHWQIISCVGHLLELAEPALIAPMRWGQPWRREELPVFQPRWPKVMSSGKEAVLARICKLAKDAERIYHAGDPDEEGQLIVDEVLDYAGIDPTSSHVMRAYINDPIEKNILRAFDEATCNSEAFADGVVAYARQTADMAFGVSESRLATLVLKKRINLGRVLTPTLGLVYERSKAVSAHTERRFFECVATLAGAGLEGTRLRLGPTAELLAGEKHLFDESLVRDIAKAVLGAEGTVQVSTMYKKTPPPLPYNLTTLQQEMNRRHGYSAESTLEATQELREKYKAITYNRTDTRYLKDEHFSVSEKTLTSAFENMGSCMPAFLDFTQRPNAFDSSKVKTHHGIIPTDNQVNVANMDERARSVYTAISFRYAAQFAPEAIDAIQDIVCTFSGNDGKEYTFEARAKKVQDAGWRTVEKVGAESEGAEGEDPAASTSASTTTWQDVTDGTHQVSVATAEVTSGKTTPPKLYTEGTLLADMVHAARFVKDETLRKVLIERDREKAGEAGGIGTPATRHTIISHLFDYGYLEQKGKSIRITEAGKKIYQLVPASISGVDMTARWYLIGERIRAGEADPDALQEAVIEEYKRHESHYDDKAKTFLRVVGVCPLCGGEVIRREKSYRCENAQAVLYEGGYKNEGCGLGFSAFIGNREISLTEAATLLKSGETARISGFKTKDGKAYTAVMYLDESGTLRLKDFVRLGKANSKGKGGRDITKPRLG